jgi:ACS family hexuronate transporter-like MFS transporter
MLVERIIPIRSSPWFMLGLLLSTQIAVAFVGRSIAPLGPLIEADLSLSKAQIGMLPAALFLGQSIISLPSGFLADRFGSRGLLLSLSYCLGLTFLLFTFINNFPLLILLVVIGGFGYGAMHTTSNRGILNWFPLNKRGSAMGIKQMGVTAGSALSAIILLPIAVEWGWQVSLLFASIMLISIGTISFMLYRDPLNDSQLNTPKDRRSSFSSSLRSLLKNKALLAISLASVGLTAAQLSFGTYLVFFLHEKLELSLYLAGFLFVVSEVFGSIGRIVWGIVSDLLFSGKRIIILIIIAIITSLCCVTTSFLSSDVPLILVFILVAIFGFCIAGFNGIWMNSATESIKKEQAGLASGFSLMLGSLGVVFGPPIFGAIVDSTGTYTFAWLFLAGLMLPVTILLLVANHAGESLKKLN